MKCFIHSPIFFSFPQMFYDISEKKHSLFVHQILLLNAINPAFRFGGFSSFLVSIHSARQEVAKLLIVKNLSKDHKFQSVQSLSGLVFTSTLKLLKTQPTCTKTWMNTLN